MLVAPIKEFVWLEKPAIVSDNAMSGVHHENNGHQSFDNCAVYKKLKKILKKDLSDLIVQLNGSEWMVTCVKTAGFSTFSKETNISGIFPDHQMTSERKARGSQELIESNIRIDTTLLIHVAASKGSSYAPPMLHPHAADAPPPATPPRPSCQPPPTGTATSIADSPSRPIVACIADLPRPAPPPASSTPCLHVNLHRLPGLETVAVIGKTNGANLFAWDDRRGLLAVGCWKRLTIFRLDNENSAPHCLFFLGCDLSVYGYGLTVTSFGFRWKLRWPVGSAQFGEWEPLSHDEARSLFAFVAPYVNEAKETKSSSSLPQKTTEMQRSGIGSRVIRQGIGRQGGR
uniref:Uncharacterized protein n=1 Tax=Oryza nivara TaxID=4536 RepID=A0A0E0IJT0_ORYNI